MTLHILKLLVGVEDVDHLDQIQKKRLKREGILSHITRNTPRKATEILEGGSIYWVIKRFIRVRQRLVGIERVVNSEGKPSCAFILDPNLVATELKEFRAFQGWRYFKNEESPADLIFQTGETEIHKRLPDDMAAELKSLGLI